MRCVCVWGGGGAGRGGRGGQGRKGGVSFHEETGRGGEVKGPHAMSARVSLGAVTAGG